MKTVLNSLIDVDKQARKIVDDAKSYQETVSAEIEQEKKKYAEAYQSRAQARIEKVKKEEESKSSEEKDVLQQNYTSLIQKMDALYDEKHLQWEEQLFALCIGR